MRSVLTNNKWKNLDMVEIISVKKKKLTRQNLMVFVNGIPFLESSVYALQVGDNRYAFVGILESIWKQIEDENYVGATILIDQILPTSQHSSSLFLAKFITSLFLGEEGFPYLQKAIETKKTREEDEFYRLYLKLYGQMEKDYEVEVLEDLLAPSPKRIVVQKNSYNGRYQSFLERLEEEDYAEALDELKSCLQMKKNYLPLEIAERLLDLVIERKKELQHQKEEQEKVLEESRVEAFIQAVQERNLPKAKEELTRFLAYREAASKDNYVGYLFLELLEMLEAVVANPTFEYTKVEHDYPKEKDAFYTFQEAISLGDYEHALEAGKRCRRKMFDKEIPKLKVSVYVSLLEYFFTVLEERQKEVDITYQIIQVNISKMHYTHAFQVYQENEERLVPYEKRLLQDLFEAGMKLEQNQPSLNKETEEPQQLSFPVQEKLALDDLVVEEPPALEPPILEEKIEVESREEELEDGEELEVEEDQEEVFYPVEPLLFHTLPTHEYFTYFLQYYQVMHIEEARYWLTQYDQLLHMNRIIKRLDQFYYALEVMSMDLLEPVERVQEKEKMYAYAYNEMRHNRLENALSYLTYYQQLDQTKNPKGWILKGYIEMQLGKYKEAIASFIEANSLSPDPDAYYFLGEIYYKQKRWNDAIFCYLTYNEFYPKESISVYLNLSECYKKMGKTFKTLKYLQQAESINREQNLGYNLIKRILQTEMLNHKKKEKADFDNQEMIENQKGEE